MSLCSDGLSSDQYFLVNFIMRNYLGPDVYSENPRNSASQRIAKRLYPYTLKQIGTSSLSVAQLQNLYYNVLRNAKSSLLLRPDMIYMYVKGYLPLEPVGKFPQFTYFFPTNLHPQKRYSPSHENVKGIVVIDDPAVAFISSEELQRFRSLSRLNDLKIDRVTSLSPQRVEIMQECSRNVEATSNGLVANQEYNSSAAASCVISKTPERQGKEQDCSRNGEETSNGLGPNQEYNSSAEVRETCKRKEEEEAVVAGCVISKTLESQGTEQEGLRNGEVTSKGLVSDQDCNSLAETRETCKRKKEEEEEAVAGHASCGISRTPDRFRETYKRKRFKNSSKKATNKKSETPKTDEPISLALVPAPPECDPEPSVVTTGTASKGNLGRSVGVIDIGVNNVAYFFQVALPGVRKDYGEFSCEIESDGKVTLEGLTTTGGKTVERHSRVFKMKKRKLCPPGPFTLSFSLPGPVDPRLFSPNFRSDGIFEAVITRHKQTR